LVLDELGEVVPEKEAAGWVLDSPAHLHHINEDLAGRGLLGLDVDGADGDEEVETRDDVAGVLDKLVEVAQLPAAVVLLHQEQLEVAHLVKDGHVWSREKKRAPVNYFLP